MLLLDWLCAGWRQGGRADNGTLVINCDPDPRSTNFSARLCRAYLDGARSAGRPVQYFSFGAGEGQENGDAWPGPLQEGLAVKHMMLICPVVDGAPPPSLLGFSSRPWLRAMTSSLCPRTIRIVFTTGVPAFLQRTVLQRSPAMQNFCGLFPTARIRQDFIGSIDTAGPEQYLWWIATIREYGSKGI
jgi:hypothetical protein